MTLIDKRCWERGCACYDSRVADETVNVVQRDDVLEEVAREFDKMPFGDTSASFARFVRDMKT
jgi:hypothetical protein